MTSADVRAGTTRLGHRPGLDGLRGTAVALVLVGHARVLEQFRMAGAAGVTVFFVLSGFLITKLLLEEEERRSIDLRAFYLRRARRLLPALPGALGLMALYNHLHGKAVLGGVLPAVTYTSNLWHDDGAFGHLWSLAVEEHFYLLWPLVVIVAPRRRLLTVALVGAGVSFAARFVFAGDAAYYLTPTRIDAILIGCALAVWFHHGHRLPASWVGWAGVAVGSLTVPTLVPWLRYGSVAATVGAVLVLGAALERPGVLAFGPLRRLGRISYGVYLFHAPIALAARQQLHGSTRLAVVVVVSIGLAELSYRLIESRWLGVHHDHRADVPRDPVGDEHEGRVVAVHHHRVRLGVEGVAGHL